MAPNSSKRQRTDAAEPAPSSAAIQHPLGVKPWGNCFSDMDKGITECRTRGLGRFASLPDTVVNSIFEWLLPADLAATSTTSRAWYVFCYHDEYWRTFVLEQYGGAFTPKPTWRATYIATTAPNATLSDRPPVRVQGFYSDLLFQPFYCAQSPTTLLTRQSLAIDTIPRVDGTTLSVADFKEQFEAPNLPVILSNVVSSWPAMDLWTDEYLYETCGETKFYAGGFHMTMKQYLHYARTLHDDQPLFIFDKHFAKTVPQLARDYSVPDYFEVTPDDFFKLLKEDRPDYRWLIFGPKGSGSSFHIDPNSTCAWNAIIRGAKKWIMFPPEVTPPGVHPSADGGEVSTPVSLMEWFVTFYKQTKSKEPVHLEGVVRAGEIIFVPKGWWHLVLNTEECLAITQNFVCGSSLMDTLAFLKDKPDQVSGVDEDQRPLLYGKFRKVLQDAHPDRVAEFDALDARKHQKSAWTLATETTAAAPFSFGF
ncbi:histone arginine demethylase [Achlya hypogyna]|uniref:Histone arginine demethylase n=1 Tax=Achlya hypogyna TaxID=1202772 RepID=A0A1V9ZDZ4_ACHHY|nr:histone arginine demethylase [Achlya hypogyna]